MGGQENDLDGSDVLMDNLTKTDVVLTDKAYNSYSRVIDTLGPVDISYQHAHQI